MKYTIGLDIGIASVGWAVINNDKIIYRVSDSSGNIKEVEKKIFFADKEGPKLSLEGLEYIYTFVGDNFDDPGAKANDNCDGDVKVTVDNSVNMNSNVNLNNNVSVINQESIPVPQPIVPQTIQSNDGQQNQNMN